MRAVEWATARNAGLTGVMGFDDAAGTPDGAPGSDDDSEEDADFATQHGATSHACLSTSLMGDGANRDPARPPGGVAAISLPPLARGGRAGLAPAPRRIAAHLAAGTRPGTREFKNRTRLRRRRRRAQARSRASLSPRPAAVRRAREPRGAPRGAPAGSSRCAATPSPSRAASARTPTRRSRRRARRCRRAQRRHAGVRGLARAQASSSPRAATH